MDKKFTFHSYVFAVCTSCYYYVQDLWHIRHHLDLNITKVLATALVPSRLDYCNSLLSGIADTDLTKLQCVQNRLACAVMKSPPFTRSVPLLHFLHWLPVLFKVDFEIFLLTYMTLRDRQPVYLHSMFATTVPSWSLRSNKGINQSTNQSNFYSANIPGKARLSGVTTKSVFNSKIKETVPRHQLAVGCASVERGKAKSKRCVFRCLLKVATENC